MNYSSKLGLVLGISLATNAFCADPAQGFYLGLQGVISHAPSLTGSLFINQLYPAEITMEPVGGGAGASIGYRINWFRIETEVLFNINNYDKLTVGSCTLISPNVVGFEGTCPVFVVANGLGFKGNTMGFYGLINAFFDLYPASESNDLVPFVGFGIGGAYLRANPVIQNNKYFANGYTPTKISATVTNTTAAGQGVIGLSYYIDDFTTIGFDYRYLTTFNINQNNNTNNTNSSNFSNQYAIQTLNFTATFAFDGLKNT